MAEGLETMSGRVQRMTVMGLDTIPTSYYLGMMSGKRQQNRSKGFGKVSIYSSGGIPSRQVQEMRSEGFGKVSISSAGGTSTKMQRLLDPGVNTISGKAQHGPEECDTCMESQLVWTRPCCDVKICLPCLETYVNGKIDDGIIDIQCPGHACNTYLTPRVIKEAIDTAKAERFSFLHVKSNRCHYKKACPMCDYITILDDTFLQYFRSQESIIVCPRCLREWCFQCIVPWHEGYSCAEYKYLQSDAGVDIWARRQQKNTGEKNAQRCPRCQIWIQKIAGCDSMTCGECKTKFCYLCGVRTPHPLGTTCGDPPIAHALAATHAQRQQRDWLREEAQEECHLCYSRDACCTSIKCTCTIASGCLCCVLPLMLCLLL